MCAGISFPIDTINAKELDQFFKPDELEKQRKGDVVETYFWQARPFLPAEDESGEVHLYHWGNRDKMLKMPKTGWARLESLQDGRWDWLSPKKVWIPSLYGYEKRKWFRTPVGIEGVRVRLNNVTRVYILTQKADQKFKNYTGHDRMPVGKIVYK